MGKLTNGLMGAFTGRVGALVGSSWKGIPYLKTRPDRRGQKRRPGEKQNQEKFKQLHQWLQPLLDFVREGFKGYSPTAEGYNAAKSYNLKHAFVEDGNNKVLDPARIRVSYGDLPLPGNIAYVKNGDRIRFSWDVFRMEGTNDHDQVMLLLYDDKAGYENMKLTGQFRYMGSDELQLPAPAGEFHVYVAFIAHDRSRQSHSVYLGKLQS